MAQSAVYAGIAAIIIASIGLWWFRVVMTGVKKQPKVTRYGIYALIWLAYFITTLLVIGNSGDQ